MALVTFPSASFAIVGTAFDWASNPVIARTLTLGGIAISGGGTITNGSVVFPASTILSIGSLTLSSVGNNQIVFGGTSGIFTGSSSLTFSGNVLAVGGSVTVTGNMLVGTASTLTSAGNLRLPTISLNTTNNSYGMELWSNATGGIKIHGGAGSSGALLRIEDQFTTTFFQISATGGFTIGGSGEFGMDNALRAGGPVSGFQVGDARSVIQVSQTSGSAPLAILGGDTGNTNVPLIILGRTFGGGDRGMGAGVDMRWVSGTSSANRIGRLILTVQDFTGTKEVFRADANGSGSGASTFSGNVAFTNNLTANGTANSLESLGVKSGANKSAGTVVLVAGTMTISNTRVTAGSIILLSNQADGGVPGDVRVSSRVAATSFSITSSSALDTSIVGWVLVEPT